MPIKPELIMRDSWVTLAGVRADSLCLGPICNGWPARKVLFSTLGPHRGSLLTGSSDLSSKTLNTARIKGFDVYFYY